MDNIGRDAKNLAIQCGIPVVPGYNGNDQSLSRLKEEVERIGFPVLLKATMGGGGRVGCASRLSCYRECEFCRITPALIRPLPCVVMKRRSILVMVLYSLKSRLFITPAVQREVYIKISSSYSSY